MPKRKRRSENPPEATFTKHKKLLVLLYCAQLPEVMAQAAQHISTAFFSRPRDDELLLVWNALMRCHQHSPKSITAPQLVAEAEQVLEEAPDTIDQQEQGESWRETVEYITQNMAWSDNQRAVEADKGLGWLRRWVEESLTLRHQEDVGDSDMLPKNLQVAVREYAAAMSRAAEITIDPDRDRICAPGWDKVQLAQRVIPTEFAPLDVLIGGGDRAGAVYGLVGAINAGKTTLAGQITLNRISRYLSAHRKKRKEVDPKWMRAYYISYEINSKEFTLRAIPYLAGIHSDDLRRVDGAVSRLSRVFGKDEHGKTCRHEVDEFSKQTKLGDKILSAYQRARCWGERLDRTLCFAGFNEAGRGMNGIDEVAQLVEADQRRRGDPGVLMITIDHVAAMSEKYMMVPGREHITRQQFIDSIPSEAVSQLAVPFKCPVWLVHQAAGYMNDKSPGARAHLSDALGSRTFAISCYYSLHLGTLYRDKQLAALRLTKARDSILIDDPAVIQLDGAYSRWKPTFGNFSVKNGRIVETKHMQDVQSGQDKQDKSPASSNPADALSPSDDE